MSELSDGATRARLAVGAAPGAARRGGQATRSRTQARVGGSRLLRGVGALIVVVALLAGAWGYVSAQGWLLAASATSPVGYGGAPQPTAGATVQLMTAQQATQIASALVAEAASYVRVTRVVFTNSGANGGALDVRVQEPDAWDAANVHEWVRLTVWEIMRAMWTSSLPLTGVSVEVDGRLSAATGATTVGRWGTARLTSATAATLSWQALNQDSAWVAYTGAWLIPTQR